MNRKSDEQVEKRLWLVFDEVTSLTSNKNRTPEEQNRLLQSVAYVEALSWALGLYEKPSKTKIQSIKTQVYDDAQMIDLARLENIPDLK